MYIDNYSIYHMHPKHLNHTEQSLMVNPSLFVGIYLLVSDPVDSHYNGISGKQTQD